MDTWCRKEVDEQEEKKVGVKGRFTVNPSIKDLSLKFKLSTPYL